MDLDWAGLGFTALGAAIAWAAIEFVRTRPAMAIRLQVGSAVTLKVGLFLTMIGGLLGLMALAAGTSSFDGDHDDALYLAAGCFALVAPGLVLVVRWWRRPI